MRRDLGHLPALDGVRAIAIGAVMGLHAVYRLVPGGSDGVDVFFVLSSFLISSLILAEVDGRDGAYNFRGFYWRRAFRLGPALLLWLALIAAPTAALMGQGDTIVTSTLASLLYVGDFAVAAGAHVGGAYVHVWSLAVEEQFYLLWPLLLVTLARRRHLRRSLLTAAGVVVIVQIVAAHLSKQNGYLPTGHLMPLAAGWVAAGAFRNGLPARATAILAHPLTGAGACAILAAAFRLDRAHTQPINLITAGAAAGLILHVCLTDNSPVMRLLRWPAIVWIGRRSYGLYLYHRTLAGLIPELVPGITLKVAGPLVVVLALLVAEISFRYVEVPVIRAGRLWLQRNAMSSGRPAEVTLPLTAETASRPGNAERPRSYTGEGV